MTQIMIHDIDFWLVLSYVLCHKSTVQIISPCYCVFFDITGQFANVKCLTRKRRLDDALVQVVPDTAASRALLIG